MDDQPDDLAAPVSPVLRVLVDGREPEVVRTVNFTVGSGMHCDLCLVGPSVAREHATIHHSPAEGWVFREGAKSTPITDGGAVQVGGFRVAFELRPAH